MYKEEKEQQKYRIECLEVYCEELEERIEELNSTLEEAMDRIYYLEG